MTTHYKNFKIEIINEPDYTPGSADNLITYALVYPDKTSDYRNLSKHGIRIMQDGKEISSALISAGGGFTGIHEKSFLIKNDTLFICCGSEVYSLEIPSLKLNWNKEIDTATCFEIYEFEDDFIVHGEVEISRVTNSGTIKWQFSGRDIFVSVNGKKEFEITGNTIKLTDFQNFQYALNSDGKQIK